MPDTRISQLPDEAAQSDDLNVPVVKQTSTSPAQYETKRQSVGTMLGGRAKTDLSNVDADLTTSEKTAIRTKIGAHESGAAPGNNTIGFDELEVDVANDIRKSVGVGGVSLSGRNLLFAPNDGSQSSAIPLPREVADPRVGDAGKHLKVNAAEDGYDLTDAPREVPSGGTTGQVVKKTATGYEWGDDTAGDDLTADAVLDLAQSTRTTADRGKAFGTSSTDQDAAALLDIPSGDRLVPSGGTEGQVVKKTATGIAWGTDETGGATTSRGFLDETVLSANTDITIPTGGGFSAWTDLVTKTVGSSQTGRALVFASIFAEMTNTTQDDDDRCVVHMRLRRDRGTAITVFEVHYDYMRNLHDGGAGFKSGTQRVSFGRALATDLVAGDVWKLQVRQARENTTRTDVKTVEYKAGGTRTKITLYQPPSGGLNTNEVEALIRANRTPVDSVLTGAFTGSSLDAGSNIGNKAIGGLTATIDGTVFTFSWVTQNVQSKAVELRFTPTGQANFDKLKGYVLRVNGRDLPMDKAAPDIVTLAPSVIQWLGQPADTVVVGANTVELFEPIDAANFLPGGGAVGDLVTPGAGGGRKWVTPAPSIPTTLPRRAEGDGVTPPSRAAVIAALDASMSDGAAAWGPSRNYTAATSLAALADGQFWRAGDRELVIDAYFGDRERMLTATAIQIDGVAYGAAFVAQGAAIAHVRSGPPTSDTASISLVDNSPTNLVRIRSSTALPASVAGGAIVMLTGVQRIGPPAVNVERNERFRVVTRTAHTFDIRSAPLQLTPGIQSSSWTRIDPGGIVPSRDHAITHVERLSGATAIEPGITGWRLTLVNVSALSVGDLISVTGVTGMDAEDVWPIRRIPSMRNFVDIANPAASASITSRGATPLSVHVDADLPTGLSGPLAIRYPDVLHTERGGRTSGRAGGSVQADAGAPAVRRPQEVIAWIRAANETAAKAGVGTATFSDAGPGEAPNGAWWNLADVPSGRGEVWELRAWVSPAAGAAGWTFGAWSATQVTNTPLVGKQFSTSIDGSSGWRDTYRRGDLGQRNRDPSTGQWGLARPLAQADRLRAAWGHVVSTEVRWSSHHQGSLVTLPAQIDLAAWRDLRVRVDILDASRGTVRSGYAGLPLVAAAPYAQRSGQPRWNDDASFTVASQAAGGTWAAVMNGVEGPAPGGGDKVDARLAMKFIRPSAGAGATIAGFLFIYEAKDTGLTHRLTFEGR